MGEARIFALAAHAAARDAAGMPAAQAAARSAGHAVATAHVGTHSIAAALYAATAVRNGSAPGEKETEVEKERKWQYEHLIEILNRVSQQD